MEIPEWANIRGRAEQYWLMLSPEYENVGTLTEATLPEFVKLCKNLARRDEIDDFLQNTNQSMIQINPMYDPNGVIREVIKESAYSKMSRDYDRIISQQIKTFRPKPEKKTKKQSKLEKMLD